MTGGLSEQKNFFARELGLVQLLVGFIASGLFFMVFPGTLMGVWNLFAISSGHSSSSVSASWVQAHGHAQLFGWVGAFILGIGFYTIPNLRRVASNTYWEGWLCLALWDTGVFLRWLTNIYQWNWQVFLPLSALLEFAAMSVFFICLIRGHRDKRSFAKLEPWTVYVITGTVGLALSLYLNLAETFRLAWTNSGPAVPSSSNIPFLTLATWGFAVPVALGFIAKWMPVFLGLKPVRNTLLPVALFLSWSGILCVLAGLPILSAVLLSSGVSIFGFAMRLFEKSEQVPKVSGVHPSFSFFVRLAFYWLMVAALFAIWAAVESGAAGIAGAGRHALTVGFLATLVFCVGPRMLPAFTGRQKLFNSSLMFWSLLVLTAGCFLRVSSEVIAYQGYAAWAWYALPVSATLELAAIIGFAVNLVGTFMQPPALCLTSGR
jgi:uncharacterized protein involved in response to NO